MLCSGNVTTLRRARPGTRPRGGSARRRPWLALALTLAGCDDGETPAGAVNPVNPADAADPVLDPSSPDEPGEAPPNEDGSELWLRYRKVTDAARLEEYRQTITHRLAAGDSPTLLAAQSELERGLAGLLGQDVPMRDAVDGAGGVIVGTPESSELVASLPLATDLEALSPDGFVVRKADVNGQTSIVIAGNTELGALYGSFRFLQHLQQHRSLGDLALEGAPKVTHRLLNHWDNLDRTVERGYAGRSLWDWQALPDELSPRYEDYARANASLGINGTVLTNVNANAQVLTPEYLARVAALADVFRPYGIRVYLTARFSAPIEIGGLTTADPASPEVQTFWNDKADEIYAAIPDFGGFLVKANSEGQPGPQDYGRSHAEGANVLADAVAEHGGIVAWRAFVYTSDGSVDRIREAYDEFQPLDGSFRDNVVVQAKNGALDFQPREPFHPLFGATPQTPIALELQITKEYLGQDTHLAYLGPLYEEVLQADTFADGPGTPVARVVDGSLFGHELSLMAGVSNVGDDANWTGSHFNQANWYVYGRMAWNPDLTAREAAEEWVRMTLSNDPQVVETATEMMMGSREAVVSYTGPLGIVHVMAEGHHYGPGPWVSGLGRPEWNSVYYHRADEEGIGFDRGPTGSNAVEQYFSPLREAWSDPATTPENLLLFFHHVGWGETMASGRSLWDELVVRYSGGVDAVREMRDAWQGLEGRIDGRRFSEVDEFLRIQVSEAKWWRDASIAYFRQFSGRDVPEGYEDTAFDLAFYLGLSCPPDRTKPRCEAVYGN